MRLDESPQDRLAKDGEQVSSADTQKGETGDTGGPPAFLTEHDGICDEAEVQDAVDNTDV